MAWRPGGAHSAGAWHEVQGRRGRAGRRALVAVEADGICEEPGGGGGDDMAEEAAPCSMWTPAATASFDPACASSGGLATEERSRLSNSAQRVTAPYSFKVVVDRTFINFVLPGAREEEAALPRSKSAPGDLGPYSVHERVATEFLETPDVAPTPPREPNDEEGEDAGCYGKRDEGAPTEDDEEEEEEEKSPENADKAGYQSEEEFHPDVEPGPAGESNGSEALQGLLRERDEEIRSLRVSVEAAHSHAAEQSRLLKQAEAEIASSRQRCSGLEKSLGKRESEANKRNVEIGKLKELLSTQEMDLAASEVALQELQESRASPQGRRVGQIEVHVRHAIEDCTIQVLVPADATFYDIKTAIARHVGSDEIFERGRLLKKQKGVHSAYKDASKVGSVRNVLVIGIDKEQMINKCADQAQRKPSEDLEARVAELETLVAKKDQVLRGVLNEVKRLRGSPGKVEEHEQSKGASFQEELRGMLNHMRQETNQLAAPSGLKKADPSALESPKVLDTSSASNRTGHRPPLPVVQVAKLTKTESQRHARASSSAIASAEQDPRAPLNSSANTVSSACGSACASASASGIVSASAITPKATKTKADQRPALPVVEVAKLVQSARSNFKSGMPSQTDLWKELQASRAKLNFSGPGKDASLGQPFSVSSFLRGSTQEHIHGTTEATAEVLESGSDVHVCKDASAHQTPFCISETSTDALAEINRRLDAVVASRPQSGEAGNRPFSISAFVRERFGAKEQAGNVMGRQMTGDGVHTSFAKLLGDHVCSNAETLAGTSGDEVGLEQGSNTDSELGFMASLDTSHLDEEVDSDARCLAPVAEVVMEQPAESPNNGDLAIVAPDAVTEALRRRTGMGFASIVATRVARKAAQATARDHAERLQSRAGVASKTNGPACSTAAPRRNIAIASGITPKWRLDAPED